MEEESIVPLEQASPVKPMQLLINNVQDLSIVRGEHCNACNEKVDNVSISFNRRVWHPECFGCDNCNKNISNDAICQKDDKILCSSCFEQQVSGMCSVCNTQITGTKLTLDDQEFHEDCLTCSICQEKIEKKYGKEDNKLFCENCYINNFSRKCFGCKQVVLGPGIKYSENTFHKSCFKCSRCEEVLQNFTRSKNDQPYCTTCFEDLFEEKCMTCKQIVTEGLKYKNMAFHEKCFVCSSCDHFLGQRKTNRKQFGFFDQSLLCYDCVDNKEDKTFLSNGDSYVRSNENVSELCNFCNKPISMSQEIINGSDRWHLECFHCKACQQSLVDQTYFQDGKFLKCSQCWAKGAPKCHQCQQVMENGGLQLESSSSGTLQWHNSCLQCSQCKETVDKDNVKFSNGLYCKPCYTKTFIKQCTSCGEGVTGEGLLYKTEYFHKECFRCAQCTISLSDESFMIKNGKKLCKECNHKAI